MDLLLTNTEEMVMKVNGSCRCSSHEMVVFMVLREMKKASSRAKALS